jgi:hypothetical protein
MHTIEVVITMHNDISHPPFTEGQRCGWLYCQSLSPNTYSYTDVSSYRYPPDITVIPMPLVDHAGVV